jgi:hypothetical protein
MRLLIVLIVAERAGGAHHRNDMLMADADDSLDRGHTRNQARDRKLRDRSS